MRILKDLTPAETAILGLVNEGETHGYDLHKTIDYRGMRTWTAIGFSSIYAILTRLEKKGLIHSFPSPDGKLPTKKRYQITSQGTKTLQQVVKQFLTTPQVPRLRIDLAIANLNAIPLSEAVQCVKTYIQQLEARITAFLKVRATQEPLPFSARMLFDHSTIKSQAELQWAKTFLSQLIKQGDQPL